MPTGYPTGQYNPGPYNITINNSRNTTYSKTIYFTHALLGYYRQPKNGSGDMCVTCFSQSSSVINSSTTTSTQQAWRREWARGTAPHSAGLPFPVTHAALEACHYLSAFPLAPSPWWFLAPCEGGYFLTGGPCSWFQFVVAVSPIQLHILGSPPGTLGALLVYSLPCSRIPRGQIRIYQALTWC